MLWRPAPSAGSKPIPFLSFSCSFEADTAAYFAGQFSTQFGSMTPANYFTALNYEAAAKEAAYPSQIGLIPLSNGTKQLKFITLVVESSLRVRPLGLGLLTAPGFGV